MRILYDHQGFNNQKFGGVSKYFVELIAELDLLPHVEAHISVLFSNNHYLKELPKVNFLNYPTFGPRRLFPTAASQINKLNALAAISRKKYDVFHPTFFHRYFLQNIGNKPFVLTFHDTAAEEMPQYPLGADYALKKQLMQKAAHIIAVSAATKADILAAYPIADQKISVVHHATRFNEYTYKDNTPKKHLLYVGTRHYYKNFLPMLRAIAPILKSRQIPLICIGGGNLNAAEMAQINKLGLEGLIKQTAVHHDATFFNLYAQAYAFIYPSLKEGFGIPILEAFAANCPAVLSDIPVFREVAGQAALYFDPTDQRSIYQTTENIFDQEQSKKCSLNGHLQLKNFSWTKAAKETLAVYNQVI